MSFDAPDRHIIGSVTRFSVKIFLFRYSNTMSYRSPSSKASDNMMAKIQLGLFALGCFAVFVLFVIYEVIPRLSDSEERFSH